MLAPLLYLLKKKPDFRTVAVINQDYAWGRDSWELWKAGMDALKPGVRVVAEMFPRFGSTDFSTEITRLLALRPGQRQFAIGLPALAGLLQGLDDLRIGRVLAEGLVHLHGSHAVRGVLPRCLRQLGVLDLRAVVAGREHLHAGKLYDGGSPGRGHRAEFRLESVQQRNTYHRRLRDVRQCRGSAAGLTDT